MRAPFSELVATADRQLALRGPVAHAEGGLWPSRIEEVDIQVTNGARMLVAHCSPGTEVLWRVG